ncbi:MAG: RecQ family zinc-binding domain-containing protein, partial [Rhodococcus sp. (in: high G+C Gram-positive bacteria)]
IWSYFASVAFPREQVVRQVIDALDPVKPQSTPALEPLVDLNRSRLEMVLKVLDVDGAVQRVRGGWITTGNPWTYDADRYERLEQARDAEQQAMIDYQSTDGCRMEFLRRQLDDPDLGTSSDRCGRCDNCTGQTYSSDVDADAVETARARFDRPGIDLPPRKQWPSGMKKLGVSLSGKIADGPEPGRVLGRLTDLGWGARLRAVLDGPDAEATPALLEGCIKVLASWDWKKRPTAVLALESDSHPMLVHSIARELARVGKLTDLGILRQRPDHPSVTAANSAFRVAGLVDSWDIPEPVHTDGPVLLIDSVTDTGWRFTCVSVALRRAGVDAVLPFALATPK